MSEWTTLVASLLSAVGMVVVAWIAGRFNVGAKRTEATIPSYADMAEAVKAAQVRLGEVDANFDAERRQRRSLEDRIEMLEDDRRHDRQWIERTIRKIIDHDPHLVALLTPWPVWYDAPTPPTLD